MLCRLRNLRRDESGFTLMEQLVVIAIVGIMSLVTVSLVAAIFDSNIRSGQMLDQQSTIESSYGFLAARLSVAQKPVGLLKTDNSGIDPLTVAGDQLVWKMGGAEGNCVRAFYQRPTDTGNPNAWGRVRVKLHGNCSDTEIRPVRGPNDTTPSVQPTAANGAGTNNKWDVGEPLWDPSIDLPPGKTCSEHYASFPSQLAECNDAGNPRGAAILADGIVSTRPVGADESLPEALELFAFRDEDDDLSWPNPQPAEPTYDRPDRVAKAASNNAWYNTLGNRADIASVDVTHYVAPTASAGVARVRTRVYQQNFSLQQVCAPVDATTGQTTPGAVFDEGRLDGTAGGGWKNVAAGAGWETVDRHTSGSPAPQMTVTNLPTGDAYLQYSGQLLLRPSAAGAVSGEVRVQLLRNDVPVTDTEMSDGRAQFVMPFTFPASATASRLALPIAGKFRQPRGASADPAGTTYGLRVQIRNPGGGAVEYSTERDYLWLSYQMVARD